MEREPREPGLIALETGAFEVVGPDWHKRLDKIFIDNLGKYRKYQGNSVQDLLRALRNKVSILVSCDIQLHVTHILCRNTIIKTYQTMSRNTLGPYQRDSCPTLLDASPIFSCTSIPSSTVFLSETKRCSEHTSSSNYNNHLQLLDTLYLR